MILHRLYWTDTQHPKKFFEVFFIVLHGHLMTDRNWIVKGSKIRDTNAFIAQKQKNAPK